MDHLLEYRSFGTGVIGWEMVGKVVEVGDNVSGIHVGDTVIAISSSGCCQSGLIIVEAMMVFLVDHPVDGMTSSALIRPGIVAYDAVFYKMKIQKNDVVLILNPLHSASILLSQLAARIGAFLIVLVTAGDDDHDKVREMYQGVACCNIAILPSIPEDDADIWLSDAVNLLVQKETDGVGCDHVFIPSNIKPQNFNIISRLCMHALAVHGTLVVACDTFEISLQDTRLLKSKGASVGYISLSSWLILSSHPHRTVHVIQDLLSKFANGELYIEMPLQYTFQNAIAALNDKRQDLGIVSIAM